MFLPMLAASKPRRMSDEDWLKLIASHLPLYVQPKLDGIRCLINENSEPVSRTLKPIPNRWIRAQLKDLKLPYGFDGELLCYDVHDNQLGFNETSSLVMSKHGTPNFKYWVFDWGGNKIPFAFRKLQLYKLNWTNTTIIKIVPSDSVLTIEQFKAAFDSYTKVGHEGVILRRPSSFYKQGRSTLKEFTLVKHKPFERGKAKVLALEELMYNNNPQTSDERGYAERSSSQINLLPANKLGAFIVKDIETGVIFNIGTGFTDEQRKLFYSANYIGWLLWYKYQANRTKKNKPIHPVFEDWIIN